MNFVWQFDNTCLRLLEGHRSSIQVAWFLTYLQPFREKKERKYREREKTIVKESKTNYNSLQMISNKQTNKQIECKQRPEFDGRELLVCSESTPSILHSRS